MHAQLPINSVVRPAVLVPPGGRSPSPELLPSDDEAESTMPVSTATLNSLPSHLPALPPKHTYLRTPVRHIRSNVSANHTDASS